MTQQFRRTLDGSAAASAVAAAEPERYRSIHQWAAQQSRRLELAALGDCAYAAVERAAALAYDQVAGVYVNLHGDGRVKFVCPWAKHSKMWPLSSAQRELTRALLYANMRQADKGSGAAPLFFFCPDRRRWVCNLGDYPRQVDALRWLEWAHKEWNAERIQVALTWLEGHTADGRRRGPQMGTISGNNRALG